MPNWLQKVSQKSLTKLKTVNLPALQLPKSLEVATPSDPQQQGLPPASIIYACAASALLVMAVYFLFSGLWFTALLILLPAIALMGFALHFLKR